MASDKTLLASCLGMVLETLLEGTLGGAALSVHCHVRLSKGAWLARCGSCGMIRCQGRELSSHDTDPTVPRGQRCRRQALK